MLDIQEATGRHVSFDKLNFLSSPFIVRVTTLSLNIQFRHIRTPQAKKAKRVLPYSGDIVGSLTGPFKSNCLG